MKTNILFLELWKGTLVLNWYYRLLGAHIGDNVQIYGKLELFDHIYISSDCYIGENAQISPYELLWGTFHVRKIRIGPNTWVGDYSVIVGGANVPMSQNILPYSHVNSETKWSKKKTEWCIRRKTDQKQQFFVGISGSSSFRKNS